MHLNKTHLLKKKYIIVLWDENIVHVDRVTSDALAFLYLTFAIEDIVFYG